MGATDSKLAFRKGVFRLFEERNIPSTDTEYWPSFWTLPKSTQDVHDLLDPSDIIKIRDSAIENIETLFDKLIDHLKESIYSKNRLYTTEILNCCRIITRIMPFIFESPDCIKWEKDFFWTPNNRNHTIRGKVLISLALDALFLSGFTIPQTLETGSTKINHVIWETGIAATTPIGSSRENDWNRIEILRLLIVLFSKPLYSKGQNRWLEYIVTEPDKKVTLALLCSMLNTCCKFNPMSWSPNTIDPRDQLVAYCIHILLVLLNYSSKMDGNLDYNTSVKEKNAFRFYLSRIHRTQDCQFLMDGIHRVLSSPMQTLDASCGSSQYHIEMMALCWRLLELNHRFANYIMETERALDLMVMLLFHADENKFATYGPVGICIYTLQTLSSDKDFGIKLNKSFNGHVSLPVTVRIPKFQGSYADYLLLSIYSLIVSSRGLLSPHYSALMKITTNVSPHLRNLSKLTSSKLVSLFGSLSAPSFLLADNDNHQSIEFLIQALNNILYFQFEYNPNLIYAIVQKHEKFKKLSTLSLDLAISEIVQKKTSTETTTPDRSHGSLKLQHRNSSTSSTISFEKLLSAGDFVPNNEWMCTWHSKLDLEPIMALIQTLLPTQLNTPNLTYYQVQQILRDNPMLSSLQPPSITYDFEWKDQLLIWFQNILWNQVFRSLKYDPWSNTNIKLMQQRNDP